MIMSRKCSFIPFRPAIRRKVHRSIDGWTQRKIEERIRKGGYREREGGRDESGGLN